MSMILVWLLIVLLVVGGVYLTYLYHDVFGTVCGYFLSLSLWESIGNIISGLLKSNRD